MIEMGDYFSRTPSAGYPSKTMIYTGFAEAFVSHQGAETLGCNAARCTASSASGQPIIRWHTVSKLEWEIAGIAKPPAEAVAVNPQTLGWIGGIGVQGRANWWRITINCMDLAILH
jgi:hypothetical protein